MANAVAPITLTTKSPKDLSHPRPADAEVAGNISTVFGNSSIY